MTLLRLCAVVSCVTLLAACEGGLLADRPPSPTLEPVPASSDAGAKPGGSMNTNPNVPLLNTYWRLSELNGGPVRPGEGRELHMILKSTDQVSGYAGCNQFHGVGNRNRYDARARSAGGDAAHVRVGHGSGDGIPASSREREPLRHHRRGDDDQRCARRAHHALRRGLHGVAGFSIVIQGRSPSRTGYRAQPGSSSTVLYDGRYVRASRILQSGQTGRESARARWPL